MILPASVAGLIGAALGLAWQPAMRRLPASDRNMTATPDQDTFPRQICVDTARLQRGILFTLPDERSRSAPETMICLTDRARENESDEDDDEVHVPLEWAKEENYECAPSRIRVWKDSREISIVLLTSY